jgi:hypothetical protein
MDRDSKRSKGAHAMDTEDNSLIIISPTVLTTPTPRKSALKSPSVHTRKATPEPLQLYSFNIETRVTPKAKAKFGSNFGLEPLDPTETEPTMTVQRRLQEVYNTLTQTRPDQGPAEDWSMMEIYRTIADLFNLKKQFDWPAGTQIYRRILQIAKTDPKTIFPPEECFISEDNPQHMVLTLTWGPKLYAAVHKVCGNIFFHHGNTCKVLFEVNTSHPIPATGNNRPTPQRITTQ